MRHSQMRYVALVVGLLLLMAVPGGDAWAGSKIFSSGTSILTVRGSVETNAVGNRDPFIVQVFSAGLNECLRLAVTIQGADLEMTLVSPSGRTWQDDDSNGALRPRIIARTDVRGWYTLMLSHFTGAATNADFALTVQRTAAGAVCLPLTVPRILVEPAAKSSSAGAGPEGGPNAE